MENQNTVAFDPNVKGELMNMFSMAAMQGSLAHSGYSDPVTAVTRAAELIGALESWHTAERAKMIAAAQAFEAEQQAAADAKIPQETVDKVVSLYPAPVSADGPVQFAGDEPDEGQTGV